MGIDISRQDKVAWRDVLEGCLDGMGSSLGIDERGVLTTLSAQLLDVDLTHLDLWLQGETVAFDEQLTILEEHRVASIDHILRRLTETTAGIDIATDGTGTLLRQERLQIGVLANELVAGREVEDDIGSCQGQIVAGRNGCPNILADLDTELHAITRHKQLGFGTDMDGAACKEDICRIQVLGRGKPTLLIELTVVGQIGLGDDTHDATTLNDDCAIIK